MTNNKQKKTIEPPLRLDMDFGEALTRFVQTKPSEVAASVERSKRRKPPHDVEGRPPSATPGDADEPAD